MSTPATTHPAPGTPIADDAASVARRRRDRRWPPMVPLAIVVTLVACAALAPVLAPHSPTEQSLPDKLKPPAWQEGGSARHPGCPENAAPTGGRVYSDRPRRSLANALLIQWLLFSCGSNPPDFTRL